MLCNIGIDNCLNSISAVECFDKDKLWYILNNEKKYKKILEENSADWDSLGMSRMYYMMSSNRKEDGHISQTGYINVTYNNRHNTGRMYADGSLSLQNMNHMIRHAIASDYYIDVDIINAHPVILEYICEEKGLSCPFLSYYNSNRELIIKAYIDKGIDRLEIKKLIISIVNGFQRIPNKIGRITTEIDNNTNNSQNIQWIVQFFCEMREIRTKLCEIFPSRYEDIKEREREERDYVNEDEDEDEDEDEKFNYPGKLISSIMSDGENIILQTMLDYFKEKNIVNNLGRIDAVLCFDGIMVDKKKYKNINLQDYELYIRERTGVPIKLKVKNMDKGLNLPSRIPSRPNPKNDIFLYEDIISKITTWKELCKIKNEIVHFINKDTIYCRGDQPMIIKENMRYNEDRGIDRVFKLDKGYRLDMSNVKFRAKLPKEEITKHDLKASDLVIDGYNLWISSKYRSDKSSIIFDPKYYYDNKPTDDVYNLFNGLEIEAHDLQDVEPLYVDDTDGWIYLIKEIWCNGKTELSDWVWNWLAERIQKPWKKSRTSLVLKSTERAGKGLGVDPLREILGKNYVFHPTSPEEILGNFNSGLLNKLFVFMDELVWGGDRQKAGTFKKLISEKKVSINAKFRSIFEVDNRANIIISSNESWIIPAGTTDTRWFVLKLNPLLATCDREKKKRIVNSIINTDIRRIAKFLYERDISNWDSDDIVITDELRDQRVHSMTPFNKWWFDCINNGYIEYRGIKKYFTTFIPKVELYNSYYEYSEDRHMVKRSFGKMVKELTGDVKISQIRVGGVRIRHIKLPELESAREIWRKKYNDSDWILDDPELPPE